MEGEYTGRESKYVHALENRFAERWVGLLCHADVLTTLLSFPESLVTRRKTADTIVIQGCKSGLGVRIVGGRNMKLPSGQQSNFGIFIKEIIEGGLGHRDGMELCSI